MIAQSNVVVNLNFAKGCCNMGRSKKQKNYDIYISPGKWHTYHTRRILFALSIVSFVLNLVLIAVFDETMRKKALIAILWSAIFAILQFVDQRKAHWDWFYIIVLSTIFLLFSAFAVFATELIFVKYIWAGELVLFLGLILLLLRKKKQKINK